MHLVISESFLKNFKKKRPNQGRLPFFATAKYYISIRGAWIEALRLRAPPASDIISLHWIIADVKALREVNFLTNELFLSTDVDRANILHGTANGEF